MEPNNMAVPPENINAESVTSTTNKNFLQGELLSRDSFEPPEDEEDWQKYQSKWTRLVQSVADNVYEQAVSPTTHQCAVLERVVQGYQHHLGLEAGTAMEGDAGSGGSGAQELESTNKTTTTATASVANSMDAPMTGTGFIDDGDTGNTADRVYWTSSSGEHDRPDDMTAEITTASEPVQSRSALFLFERSP
jgi:hypothetical protein